MGITLILLGFYAVMHHHTLDLAHPLETAGVDKTRQSSLTVL
jgi:hypothetical protein